MSLEEKMAKWLEQPDTFVTEAERQFIFDMRKAANNGVGYGWMQQHIEWEWQSKSIGAWGPEYFQKIINELEKNKRAQQGGNDARKSRIRRTGKD